MNEHFRENLFLINILYDILVEHKILESLSVKIIMQILVTNFKESWGEYLEGLNSNNSEKIVE